MFTERDLQQAITECHAERNPNANTCIKLASYYTIKNELYGKDASPQMQVSYSRSARPYESDSDFMRTLDRVGIDRAIPVLDELMETLQILNPRLYSSAMRKLRDL